MSSRHIISTMKKTSKTKFAILGLLTIDSLSGYQIKKLIQDKLSHFWAESNGQIYPTLNQLIKEKLTSLKTINSNGKNLSKIYSITKLGFLELKNWMYQEDEKSIYRNENLLKLFFGKNISKEICIKRLKNKKQKLQKKLTELKGIYQEIEKKSKSPHYIYWKITLKNGIYSIQADIKWCNESIKTLQKIEK